MPAMMQDSRYVMSNLNGPTRRISRPSRGNDSPFPCSQQSVLSAMDRFVKSVNNMDSTVLVPSRLLDIEVSNENSKLSKCLPASLNNTDVYGFFGMLKDVKNELLWGPTTVQPSIFISPSSGRSSPGSPRPMKHFHDSSYDSLGSSTGFDQELDSDMDSLVTDPDSLDEQSSAMPSGQDLASAFRHHLLGLHTILHELADSADYLSSRYQEEIETPTS